MAQTRGKVYLDDGRWRITSGETNCHFCGTTIHFKPPKRPWDELLDNYQGGA